jgi:hypothetical protein
MNIPSHFSIRKDDYDAIMKVSVSGPDRQLILDSIFFELDNYTIAASQPDDNLATIDRFLFFKSFKDIEETDK